MCGESAHLSDLLVLMAEPLLDGNHAENMGKNLNELNSDKTTKYGEEGT